MTSREVSSEGARHGAAGHYRAAFLIAAGAVLVAIGIAAYWSSSARPEVAPAALPAVPVSIAVAARRSVPIYLTGLGSVQASLTVGIRSQVNGTLREVSFTEGQEVKKGDVLARIDPRLFKASLDQAQARKAQNAALLASAVKDLARYEILASSKSISRQTLDQQRATVDQLKASIEADDAAIDTARIQLGYTTITVPSDGRIGIRSVDPGNVVHVSDAKPIATLVRLRPSAVLFTLPARFLDAVRDALAQGPVVVTAFDQNDQRVLSAGTLLLIDDAIDPATDTIRLKAVFTNEDERLWPGAFVNAHVLLKTLRDAVVIPSTAVQRGPQGLFVWIVTSQGTAEPRPIETGPTVGDLTVITSGVIDGDRVVTDGQYKLKLGAKLRVVSPPPSTPRATE